MQELAKVGRSIFAELGLQPRELILGLREAAGLGGGYEGRAITGRNRRVYIELEVGWFPLSDLGYWQGILWQEAMHAKYTLEGRCPTMWPFYLRDVGPVWAIDCLLHFSMDGWLEKQGKPVVYFPPAEAPDADFETSRLFEWQQACAANGYAIDDERLRRVADALWGRDTTLKEVGQIMESLGMSVPADIPLGQYLRGAL